MANYKVPLKGQIQSETLGRKDAQKILQNEYGSKSIKDPTNNIRIGILQRMMNRTHKTRIPEHPIDQLKMIYDSGTIRDYTNYFTELLTLLVDKKDSLANVNKHDVKILEEIKRFEKLLEKAKVKTKILDPIEHEPFWSRSPANFDELFKLQFKYFGKMKKFLLVCKNIKSFRGLCMEYQRDHMPLLDIPFPFEQMENFEKYLKLKHLAKEELRESKKYRSREKSHIRTPSVNKASSMIPKKYTKSQIQPQKEKSLNKKYRNKSSTKESKPTKYSNTSNIKKTAQSDINIPKINNSGKKFQITGNDMLKVNRLLHEMKKNNVEYMPQYFPQKTQKRGNSVTKVKVPHNYFDKKSSKDDNEFDNFHNPYETDKKPVLRPGVIRTTRPHDYQTNKRDDDIDSLKNKELLRQFNYNPHHQPSNFGPFTQISTPSSLYHLKDPNETKKTSLNTTERSDFTFDPSKNKSNQKSVTTTERSDFSFDTSKNQDQNPSYKFEPYKPSKLLDYYNQTRNPLINKDPSLKLTDSISKAKLDPSKYYYPEQKQTDNIFNKKRNEIVDIDRDYKMKIKDQFLNSPTKLNERDQSNKDFDNQYRQYLDDIKNKQRNPQLIRDQLYKEDIVDQSLNSSDPRRNPLEREKVFSPQRNFKDIPNISSKFQKNKPRLDQNYGSSINDLTLDDSEDAKFTKKMDKMVERYSKILNTPANSEVSNLNSQRFNDKTKDELLRSIKTIDYLDTLENKDRDSSSSFDMKDFSEDEISADSISIEAGEVNLTTSDGKNSITRNKNNLSNFGHVDEERSPSKYYQPKDIENIDKTSLSSSQ